MGSMLLRHAAKKLLYAAGYSVRRRSSPIRTFGEFFATLKYSGFHPATVFDVGVAQGTPELYSSFPEATLVLIEPLAEFEAHMKAILNRRHGFMYLAAAGETKGNIVLNLYPDPRKTSRHRKMGPNVPIVETRKVPMMPLDDIVADHELQASFLVKLDVEGDELSVLRGASVVLAQSEVVVLEMSVAKRFDGEAGFVETISFLAGQGFRLCDIVGAADTPQGLLSQVDLAFLRVNGELAGKMYRD
jgi:FkbM family methyltransferase